MIGAAPLYDQVVRAARAGRRSAPPACPDECLW